MKLAGRARPTRSTRSAVTGPPTDPLSVTAERETPRSHENPKVDASGVGHVSQALSFTGSALNALGINTGFAVYLAGGPGKSRMTPQTHAVSHAHAHSLRNWFSTGMTGCEEATGPLLTR
jgi:hypothetical protein